MDLNVRFNDGPRWGLCWFDGVAAILLGKREIALTWDARGYTVATVWGRSWGRWMLAVERA